MIFDQVEKNLNTSPTSSLGRVFDAAASLIGVGTYNYFEAQLPMALEAIAASNVTQSYKFALRKGTDSLILSFGPMLEQLIEDVKRGADKSIMSAKFHNTVAQSLLGLAKAARDATGIENVALSGGVFCNRYLTCMLTSLLKQNNFCVLLNRYAPINDGGISLGQAAIAVRKAVLKRF
jgi:hydrogenase maturation protein HypF